jgi:hypothetical protein
MTIFRKSKRRKTPLDRMGRIIKKDVKENGYTIRSSKPEQESNVDRQEKLPKKKKSGFLFPWWFKIAAYAMSLSIIGISAFFIAIKGILLGDLEVKKWLTSFFSSVLSSVFLTQPIKVIKI